MSVYKDAEGTVGSTPLIELKGFAAVEQTAALLWGKLESRNPAGSIKDRVARAMLNAAEKEGALTADTTIIEPTSGNTGIGLAAVAAIRDYRLVLTMPETMSLERRKLLLAYGAELVLTPGSEGMQGAIDKAHALAAEYTHSFIPNQFTNPANPAIHRTTTGPEIWEASDGLVDVFVSAVGTGGTITGVGEYLKSRNQDIKVVAVEPAGSPVLSEGRAGKHKIQGIGTGFVPEILNTQIYDEVIAVADGDAFTTARSLAKTDGILVGISSGAAVWAAAQLGKRAEYANKHIVVILPDSGERYLSTELFE